MDMRTRFFVSLLSLPALAFGWASAQTPPPAVRDVPQPAQPAAPPDPAKIADFEKRFNHGKELEQAGKLAEARAVFDGIITDSPNAKGSLREAGFISVRLGEWAKANNYFEKLHLLVP